VSSFLLARDLCHLSVCGHKFLPFRTQIFQLEIKFWSPRLLTHMSNGGLAELTTLTVTHGGFLGFASSDDFLTALALAFQRLEKLEHLEIPASPPREGFDWKKVLNVGLGATRKAALKSLSIEFFHLTQPSNEELPASIFQGFTNLRKIELVA
jgi:hypothetical protein